ncbi:uncharacterized protein isoform X2 [Rhodnius prolixus]
MEVTVQSIQSQELIQSNEAEQTKETEKTNKKPELSDYKEVNPAFSVNNNTPSSDISENSELNHPLPLKTEEEILKQNEELKTTPVNNTKEIKPVAGETECTTTILDTKQSEQLTEVKLIEEGVEKETSHCNEVVSENGSNKITSENLLKEESSVSINVDETVAIKSSLPKETNNKEAEVVENDSKSVKETKPTETKEENCNKEEECDPIDLHELTEQMFNILNDGKSETLLTHQELLKKNLELQEFIVKLVQVLKEKTNLCANLERQNSALIAQSQSLKDVISITKDLLGIRNMEVEHLHADMTSMEERIKDERVRHNTAVARLSEAMKLNDKLKAEYLVQMDLFQKLREKYNEKVVILTRENQRLLELVKNRGLENDTNPEENDGDKSNSKNVEIPEEIVEENVDK